MQEGKPLYDATRLPVLVIEDDEVTRLLYKKYLKDTVLEIIPAASIREAKVLLQSVKPVAIILDILLPNEDAWQFLSELKSRTAYKDIPVISASVVDEKDKGFMLGASEYIVKPVDQNTLLQKLNVFTKKYPARKILIIDDDEITRYVFKGYLANTNFIIIEATNGVEGLQKALDEKPDVIFLDLVMPQMNGFEVLKKLKENPHTEHIPVIILSSKVLSQEEKADLEQHIVAILTKEAPSREAAVMKIKNTVLKALNLLSQGGDV